MFSVLRIHGPALLPQNRQMAFGRTYLDVGSGLAWQDERLLCFLANDERHFGHAIRADRWHAYDATKPASTGDICLYLGAFATREEAKEAVEQSISLKKLSGGYGANI